MLYLIQEDVMVLKIAFVGFIFILNPQMEMKKKMPKDLEKNNKFL